MGSSQSQSVDNKLIELLDQLDLGSLPTMIYLGTAESDVNPEHCKEKVESKKFKFWTDERSMQTDFYAVVGDELWPEFVLARIKKEITDIVTNVNLRDFRRREVEFKFPAGLAPNEQNVPKSVLGKNIITSTLKTKNYDYILVKIIWPQ